jgi:hypothetical protein
MKKRPPSVALIWIYQGKNPGERRSEIETFEYPDFTVVERLQDVPAHTEICIFWMDDDKPVSRRFISEMTQPLVMEDDFKAIMHFWSGNAISLPKTMLENSVFKDDDDAHSLLKRLLPTLDLSERQPNGRVHVAFSSTERLAPLTMEPVGYPS